MKLRVGDEVKVTSGKDKGRVGKIEKVFPKKKSIVIAGLNMYKRHYKPRKANEKGGIIDIVRPLPIGNIAFICPKCKSVTRIGFTLSENKKVRVCRKCKQEV